MPVAPYSHLGSRKYLHYQMPPVKNCCSTLLLATRMGSLSLVPPPHVSSVILVPYCLKKKIFGSLMPKDQSCLLHMALTCVILFSCSSLGAQWTFLVPERVSLQFPVDSPGYEALPSVLATLWCALRQVRLLSLDFLICAMGVII